MDESKKTIVAFAAGLLIGALLVWAFTSAMPAVDQDDDRNDNESGLLDDNDSDDNDDEDDATDDTDDRTTDEDDSSDDEDETFSIDDQDAGNTVELGNINFPEGAGWIAVADHANGESIRFLGAARYNSDAGLEPTRVDLLRATEAGKSYRVSFFKDNGDSTFSRVGGDTEIQGEAAYFEAE